MIFINSVQLIGRLTSDPTLKFIPGSGTAVANFSIAVDKGLSREKKYEFEQQGKPSADFINIVAFGKQAENCASYLSKGKLVAVQGSITTEQYEKNNEKRTVTKVNASRVEFLEWNEKKEEKKEEDFSFEDYQRIDDDDDTPF